MTRTVAKNRTPVKSSLKENADSTALITELRYHPDTKSFVVHTAICGYKKYFQIFGPWGYGYKQTVATVGRYTKKKAEELTASYLDLDFVKEMQRRTMEEGKAEYITA